MLISAVVGQRAKDLFKRQLPSGHVVRANHMPFFYFHKQD